MPRKPELRVKAVELLGRWTRLARGHLPLGAGCSCGSPTVTIRVADLERDVLDYLGSRHAAARNAPSIAGLLRTVAKGNTVRLGPTTLQVLAGPVRLTYAKAKVEIQERLDGSLVVCYQGKVLGTSPAPAAAPLLRARKGMRPTSPPAATKNLVLQDMPSQTARGPANGTTPRTPGPHHPWRKPAVLTNSRKSSP